MISQRGFLLGKCAQDYLHMKRAFFMPSAFRESLLSSKLLSAMHLFAEKKYLPNHRMAQSIEWETAKLRNTEAKKKIPAVRPANRPAWPASSVIILVIRCNNPYPKML